MDGNIHVTGETTAEREPTPTVLDAHLEHGRSVMPAIINGLDMQEAKFITSRSQRISNGRGLGIKACAIVP
jgi:hypothetical protein